LVRIKITLSLSGSIISSKGVIDNKEFMRPISINVMGTVNVCKYAA